VFAEELAKIKDSEACAEQLQKQTKVEIKQMLAEAEAEAGRMIETAEQRAKETYDSFINEGLDISDQQYEQHLKKMKEEFNAMIEQAKANQSKAVEFIAERIVSASVNN